MALRLASVALFALPALAQVAVWGQCGGMYYTGSKTCAAGSTCVYQNDWYSQCLPGSAPPPSTTSTTSTTSSTPNPPTSSSTSSPVSSPDTGSSSTSTSTTTSTSPGTTCASLTTNPTSGTTPKLPDPFTKVNGQKVTTKADFTCRQAEISQLFQLNELGTKPPKPSSVTGSISGNTLTINVSDSGKSISFTVGISYPSSGSAPFPAIIAYGGMSIPTPAGVAVLTFNNDDMAAQTDGSSRGQGKFYTLYGSGHSAGAMMAWAWGVSRIIDALEGLPAATSRIDLTKIGVTGCSRNGKGAFVAGAFDTRVALTIPQESGSGGAACWRLSDYQKSQGQNVQTASEIVGENVWFSTLFNAFSNNVPKLPVDHHELAALVAPRGLFVIENTSMEWLGNLSTYGCMKAGTTAYQALGVPGNMGYSQIGNHNHCQFPSSQQADLDAFINKFLRNQSTNTNIFRSDGNLNYDQAGWQPWTVPTLT